MDSNQYIQDLQSRPLANLGTCTFLSVTPMGLEPITRGLKDRYSSQLSYKVIHKEAEEVGVEPTRVVSS